MNAKSSASTTEVHLPALQSEAAPVLVEAVGSHPEHRTRKFLAALRQQLVAILNAAIAQHGEATTRASAAVQRTCAEFTSGVSFIHTKKGMEGVQEYLDPERLHEIVAIGRKLRRTYMVEPFAATKKRNRINEEEVLSRVVAEDLEFTYAPQIVSGEFRQNQLLGHCSSYPELLRFANELQKLDHALELADLLGVDSNAIEEGKGNKSESGLRSVLDETEHRVSYLEIAIFCAVFAKRHGIRTKNPLTFPSKEAKRFLDDFDGRSLLREQAVKEYHEVCETLFPNHKDEAWALLHHYLDLVKDHAIMQYGGIRKMSSPEFMFPVQQISTQALEAKKRRRKRRSH
jgi:hypothetical protein